nr:MAG TPA: hypothetical protein [Caudoviricetes sp.]
MQSSPQRNKCLQCCGEDTFSDIPAKVKGVRGRLKFRHPRWRRGTIPLKGDK